MKRISEHDLQSLTNALTELENFVFLESSKISGKDHLSMLFTDPVDWLVCTAEDSAIDFLDECEKRRREGAYLAGWFAYEFGYLLEPTFSHFCQKLLHLSPDPKPLAMLGVFDKPIIFDHSTNLFSDNRSWPQTAQTDTLSHKIRNIQTNIDHKEYISAIQRIKEYIAAGHTYQVNYTMKLKFDFSGSLADLYRTLRRNQSVSYGAWIRHDNQDIISLSPELFYRVDGERITVRPMKGTMARGRTTKEDTATRSLLQNDPKNRSENIMIVDLLRNDLGRLLYDIDGGQIRPQSIFDIETYETLLQMTSTIEGTLKSGRQPELQQIIKAIFPCGSITGAPKVRTMEIIHELEKEERGVYCGAIGYCGPDETVFNVPIRTLLIKDDQGEMGIGGGIIHDSDPEGEWQESLLKGNFLTRPIPEFQLFETMLWQPGSGYWLLEEHLERITDSASYFLFSCDVNEVNKALEQAADSFTTCQRVRLLLHRDGGLKITATELPVLGFKTSRPLQPVVSTPLPEAAFSLIQTDPDSRYLFHKTTVRETYDEARQQATKKNLFEILFTNNRNEVTEGSFTNVFIKKDGLLFTPPLDSGLLNGTFRRFLLRQGHAQEQVLSRQDILAADKVYVGNSVRGLVQVAMRSKQC
ncbi:MAG: aminodeoxychorismate synthase component I [Desulforhopalus sp.]